MILPPRARAAVLVLALEVDRWVDARRDPEAALTELLVLAKDTPVAGHDLEVLLHREDGLALARRALALVADFMAGPAR